MQALIDSLKAGAVRVRFVKSDGTERSMLATINENMIPAASVSTGDRKRPADLVTVWDMEVGQWRSFRKDRLLDWHRA